MGNLNKTNFKEFAYLLERAREGDDNAFQEIYHKTKGAQIVHLVGVMGETDEVKDALQEVYALLYKNLDKINPPTVLIAYLNRLSFYIGKNHRRKESHRNHTFTDLEWLDNGEGESRDDVLQSIEDREKLQLVRRAVKDLPQPEQSVIFMRYYQKMKHQDVAISLGVTTAKAKRLQKAAQEMLRTRLEDQGIRGWSLLVSEALTPKIKGWDPAGQGAAGSTGAGSSAAGTSAAGSSVTGSAAAGTSLAFSSTGGVVAAGAVMIGISAAILGGSSFLGSPSIASIYLPADMTNGKAEVRITADSKVPVRKAILKSTDGEKVTAVRDGLNTYTAKAPENGTYTVTLTANNGRTAERKVTVDCIDREIPNVLDISSEKGRTVVTFAPDESGIDFDSVYCLGSKDAVKPETVDPEGNSAVFKLPGENHVLYFRDNAGNLSQMPLFYEAK